jgi:hypothetical protein
MRAITITIEETGNRQLEISLLGNLAIIADMHPGAIARLMMIITSKLSDDIAKIREMEEEELEIVKAIQELADLRPTRNPHSSANDHEII